MNKLIILGVMGLFLIGFVSSYICLAPATDNQEVKEFKTKINYLALEEDIKSGLTEDAWKIKLKYFSPCR